MSHPRERGPAPTTSQTSSVTTTASGLTANSAAIGRHANLLLTSVSLTKDVLPNGTAICHFHATALVTGTITSSTAVLLMPEGFRPYTGYYSITVHSLIRNAREAAVLYGGVSNFVYLGNASLVSTDTFSIDIMYVQEA